MNAFVGDWPEMQGMSYNSQATSSASESDRQPAVPKAVPIKLDFAAYRREKSAPPQPGAQESAAEASLQAFQDQAFQEQMLGMQSSFNSGPDLVSLAAAAASSQQALQQPGYPTWEASGEGFPMNSALFAAAASEAAPSAMELGYDDDENRYYGVIRDYNESGGFGFIECPPAKARFGMDVWIHRRQFFGFQIGEQVSFVVARNHGGQPQARNVVRVSELSKLKAKRQANEKRTELQLRQKASAAVVQHNVGHVMTEEEARRFQSSLKRKRS
jgi:cold shock CspA family protein